MTFDARSGSGGTGSSRKDVLFGVAILSVVASAFFLTLKAPSFGGPSPERNAVIAQAMTADGWPAAFDSREAKTYFEALSLVSPEAAIDLKQELSGAHGKNADAQFKAIYDHAATVLKSNADDLAKARTSHVDHMLTATQKHLKAAARSGSPWCMGGHYAGLANGNLQQIEQLSTDAMTLGEPIRNYTFEMLTLLMDAAEDARYNPMRHGQITPQDETAVQGVMMSLVADPQVMPLLMAAQTGADPEALLETLNVCDLAATAVMATKTLPQDTKGRLWANIIREAEAGGADLSRLNEFSGF